MKNAKNQHAKKQKAKNNILLDKKIFVFFNFVTVSRNKKVDHFEKYLLNFMVRNI